jgi:hypothetical protein
MSWGTSKSITSVSKSSKVKTTVKAGKRKLENILIRRIPVNLLMFQVGHYWIELLHEDEEKVDPFMARARINGLKEEDIIYLQNESTKANGFRESYGWYPVGIPFRPQNIFNGKRTISNDGVLNGDSEKRRKKDKKKELIPNLNREAGRKENYNEHSIRPFDPHQNSRFHPNDIKFTNHPYVLSGDNRTDEQIFNEIREFAQGFKDEWSWANDRYDETNCHTLLFLLLANCNLADPDCIGEELDRHFKRYKKSLAKKISYAKEEISNRMNLIKKLNYISVKAKSEDY